MKNSIALLFFALFASASPGFAKINPLTNADIDKAWQQGNTLPSNVFENHPIPMQPVEDDRGINVLIDLAHQVQFTTMWSLPQRLNQNGYRAIGSQASLHTVLDPDRESRIRLRWDEENRIYPFAWHPNFEYNVIITHQNSAQAQSYTPEEQEALIAFVQNGGGLLVFGRAPANAELASGWSLNAFLGENRCQDNPPHRCIPGQQLCSH
jgi:hypothetical protein